MAGRDEILAFADDLLEVDKWPEFGPAGAQVLGTESVQKLACGVSASLELFRRAGAAGAQLVLVHHGIFWRNEPLVIDRRQRGRLEALFAADMTLAAYHLALDAHPEVGNAAQLARRLDVAVEQSFERVGVGGVLPEPVALEQFAARVEAAVERVPLVLRGGPPEVTRVAISTGQAGHALVRAAYLGYDVLVTGEAEEPNLHAARELGIHLIAAGHYATERLGVQALAQRIEERFGVPWEFIEVPNPI